MRNAISTTSAYVTSWHTSRQIRRSMIRRHRTGTDDVRRGMGCGHTAGKRDDSRVQQVIYNPQNVTVVNTNPA